MLTALTPVVVPEGKEVVGGYERGLRTGIQAGNGICYCYTEKCFCEKKVIEGEFPKNKKNLLLAKNQTLLEIKWPLMCDIPSSRDDVRRHVQDHHRHRSAPLLHRLHPPVLVLHPPLPQELPQAAHRFCRDDLPEARPGLPHKLPRQQRAPGLAGIHRNGNLQNTRELLFTWSALSIEPHGEPE